MVATIDPARTYTPYGAVHSVWQSRKEEMLIAGPAGTGKTRGVLEKLNLAAMKYPGMRGLIVRKTRVSLTESVLVTFEDHVLPELSPIKEGPHRSHRMAYHYPNGSEIVLGGLDKTDRFMSTEYDMICVFEATEITEDDLERLITRLRHGIMPYQQIICDCNPAGPLHWLKTRSDGSKMLRFDSTHMDNPLLYDHKKKQWTREGKRYRGILSELGGHRRDRLFLGAWAAAEGLVYPGLEGCFIEPMQEIPVGRYFGGMDFGWNDPFAALGAVQYAPADMDLDEAIEEQRDILYVFYERYKRKTSLSVHGAAIKSVYPEGYGRWFADPSRPGSIRDLRKAGITVRGARNDILTGIDAVDARINSGRLLISEECKALRAEGQSYKYPEDKEGEKPVDEFNHAMDALRYLVMGVDADRIAKRPEPQEDE